MDGPPAANPEPSQQSHLTEIQQGNMHTKYFLAVLSLEPWLSHKLTFLHKCKVQISHLLMPLTISLKLISSQLNQATWLKVECLTCLSLILRTF